MLCFMDNEEDSKRLSRLSSHTAGVLSEVFLDSGTTSYIKLPPSEVERQRDTVLLPKALSLCNPTVSTLLEGRKGRRGMGKYGCDF